MIGVVNANMPMTMREYSNVGVNAVIIQKAKKLCKVLMMQRERKELQYRLGVDRDMNLLGPVYRERKVCATIE